MSQQRRGWRGAPDDPPRTTPHVRAEIAADGQRLQLVEEDDAWISAGATVALDDYR